MPYLQFLCVILNKVNRKNVVLLGVGWLLVVDRCGVWCAGLDRAGPGGAACRLLAALRGRRSVQIVTSAGKYVVTKFPYTRA